VLAWSLGNELAFQEGERGIVGPGYSRFVIDGARAIRRLDRGRLVAIDRHSRLGEPIFAPALTQLDALGINEYFGWYRTAPTTRSPSRTAELGPFLDQVHAAYPRTALFITEFGAESTFNGAEGQRGSFAYQTRYLRDHLGIHGSRPFVNGSMIWILKDFRVTATWTGGNDRRYATPPWNNKGLIDQHGAGKPAFGAVRGLFRRTRPLK
jgi:hypothetical protein